MKFTLLSELCESRVIPSKQALNGWKADKLRELAYLYFLGLRIALAHEQTKGWARAYIAQTIRENGFDQWRSDGNDLYTMLYALCSDDTFASETGIALAPIRDWMHHTESHLDQHTHRLFNRLDAMFGITHSDLKSYRRRIANWRDLNRRERDAITVHVIQNIQNLAPKSELLAKLKSLSKHYRDNDEINETASGGATGAASVASVTGGLGAGFDPDGDWRSIYGKQKPIVIRRNPKSTQKKNAR